LYESLRDLLWQGRAGPVLSVSIEISGRRRSNTKKSTMMKTAFAYLTFAVAAVNAVELTMDTWDDYTAGKSVFVKVCRRLVRVHCSSCLWRLFLALELHVTSDYPCIFSPYLFDVLFNLKVLGALVRPL
jgi:hypothetical protein